MTVKTDLSLGISSTGNSKEVDCLLRKLDEDAARLAAATVVDVMKLSGKKAQELPSLLREAHERALQAIERAKMAKRSE